MPDNLKKKRRKHVYFTKDNEDAIVKYNNSTDFGEREHLYRSMIQGPLSEMVDKIVYTYRFTTLPNIDELKDECKIWLTTVLCKFDPAKGSKAFSYFSVITKNWFIHRVKQTSKRRRQEVSIEDLMISGQPLDDKLITECNYDEQRETAEFWKYLWQEIDSWESESMKPNEKKVLEAIRIILSNPDAIEIFNKKAIYLYIREITGLNTKQIVNNLNKMRVKYRSFKTDWNRGKI